MKPLTCREALQLLLDQVDFRNGACSPTEMVGALIPEAVFERCDETLTASRAGEEGKS